MDPEEQREIASKGGVAAHESGNAHEWDEEEAAEAGEKGGRTVSRDREHMAEIGRLGGLAAHHHDAAHYHEAAAHHHRQAATHVESGEHERARRHADTAHEHSSRAHSYSQKAHGKHRSHGNGRGFAAMDESEQREISRRGGRASHGGRPDEEDNE